jgi:hypothetical protein
MPSTWRVNNSTALGGEVCSQWQANHAYSLGARCVCTTGASSSYRPYVYEVTTAGTSHASTQPTWPTTPGNTVVDNGVTWTCRSPSDGTWDNATCCLLYLIYYGSSTVSAGDTILIDDGHSETMGTFDQYAIRGTNTYNSPIKYICVDKATDTISTGALISTNQIFYFREFSFHYGITYKTSETIRFYTESYCIAIMDNCTLWLTGDNQYIYPQSSNSIEVRLIDCTISFDKASNNIRPDDGGHFIWRGGSLTAPNGTTALFDCQYGPDAHIFVSDVDLSAVGDDANARSLVRVDGERGKRALFTRCKLPSDAGFTKTVNTWPRPLTGSVRLHHCSSANNTYDFYEESYEGTVQDETTLVRTGGASDGTTSLSFKMVSSANVVDNINALVSPDIHGWTGSTTEKTFTIHCLVDSATNLQDDEVWMELEYPADNSSGLGSVARDKCAMLGTPADKSSSSETWTTTGMSNPNEFKCSVTVTPGKAGPITARVYLAKASTTIYVDPIITES